MNTNDLTEFEEKFKCFVKATDCFWKYVDSWKLEEPEEYFEAFGNSELSNLVLNRGKLALVINYYPDEPIEYVQTTLNIMFEDKIFAEYRFLQNLNGEIMDDGLSFH
ncbi:hypothetical protein JNUCC31_08235 [Paenibacillus sp. JNUCC31]|uniref:hypothetical protein n=1 Tax=Paenibacillus sp. JNUCC-31 TaxID=2777983 RepID=UPI0017847BE0|nr:hypothetical protein [Paenibacillus sp. JNUCC-31]QOS80848.1 hypothetical protein JNUCC31_08235 [Paenibacillus sp. JNUCC-31]